MFTEIVPAEIVVAIITAVASFVLAVVNLFISRDAQKSAARAEELSKRSEQVRIKATEAGEKLLTAMSEIIIPSETILQILSFRNEKMLSDEETVKYFAPMAHAAAEMGKLLYKSALYTTPDIRTAIEETLKPVFAGGVDFSEWGLFVDNLRERHYQLAAMFSNTYLKGAF